MKGVLQLRAIEAETVALIYRYNLFCRNTVKYLWRNNRRNGINVENETENIRRKYQMKAYEMSVVIEEKAGFGEIWRNHRIQQAGVAYTLKSGVRRIDMRRRKAHGFCSAACSAQLAASWRRRAGNAIRKQAAIQYERRWKGKQTRATKLSRRAIKANSEKHRTGFGNWKAKRRWNRRRQNTEDGWQ